MLIIVFSVAHLAIVPADAEAAIAVLSVYANERAAHDAGLTADDYAAAVWEVAGQEFAISDLVDVGALTEDYEPTEGVVTLRLA